MSREDEGNAVERGFSVLHLDDIFDQTQKSSIKKKNVSAYFTPQKLWSCEIEQYLHERSVSC